MAIFGSKNKEGNLCCNFSFFDGIESIEKGIAVEVSLTESNLSIRERVTKKQPITLQYEQICGVAVVTEKEIEEKSKSTIGRAVVGGVVLGPLGAIVGGVSGVGNKKKTKINEYFVVNYHPFATPEDIAAISFEVVGATLHLHKLAKALKEKINVEEIETERPTSL